MIKVTAHNCKRAAVNPLHVETVAEHDDGTIRIFVATEGEYKTDMTYDEVVAEVDKANGLKGEPSC